MHLILTRMYRFQGSNSISSDMYFNRDTGAGAGAGGMKQSQSYYSNMQVGVSGQL